MRLPELFRDPCFLKTWPVFLGVTHVNVTLAFFVQGGGVAEIEWVGLSHEQRSVEQMGLSFSFYA